jgi:hypothetical protein
MLHIIIGLPKNFKGYKSTNTNLNIKKWHLEPKNMSLFSLDA